MIENLETEFKREFTPDIKKTVVAFANTAGGTVYIGIDDSGNEIGIPNPDETILQAANTIRDSIKPDVTMFVSYDAETREGKNIVSVHVQRGVSTPYYLASKGIRPEGVYVRQGASSVPASENAILSMIKETDGNSFEEKRALIQDLTFEAAEKAFKQRDLVLGQSQMRTLGLINDDELYSNLALLLSDQNPSTIKAAVFEGDGKTTFKDRFEFTGSLLKQLEEAAAFINRYNRTSSHLEGLTRVDTRDYPDEAIREALLNAVVHRDYGLSGPTLISIFDDKVEFVTLGGLAKGIDPEDLELGISITRNKQLANVFYRLGLIEAYGTGIPKIRESYAGCPKNASIQVTNNAFKIVLPSTRNNSAPTDEDPLSNEAIALGAFSKTGTAGRKDIESLLKVSTTTANKILKSLMRQDLIEQVGKGRSTTYRRKDLSR